MGGGSSVMGMVAYRGTPDDYAEWEAHGAAGWGWNDVLPFYRKLEHDLDFGGELHGSDGPVPIRRTRPEDWAPLSKAVARLRAGAPDPVHRRHERGFPRRLRRGADEQLAGQARVGGDLLSRRRGARARQSDHHQRRDRDRLRVRGPPRHRRQRADRRRGKAIQRARDHPLRRRRAFARLPAARRASGRPAHLRELGIEVRADLPGVGENLSNHAIVFLGLLQHRDARQARIAAAAPDDGVPLFLRACRARRRPTCTSTCSARPRGSPLGFQVANLAPTPAQADGARPRLAARRARPRRPASSSTSPATSSTSSASCRASAARSRSWRTRRCAP